MSWLFFGWFYAGDDGERVSVTLKRHQQIVTVLGVALAIAVVALQRNQFQPVAVEADRGRAFGSGIALDLKRGGDRRLLQPKCEIEPDRGDQPGKRRIVLTEDLGRSGGRDGGIRHLGVAIGGGGSAGDIHGMRL